MSPLGQLDNKGTDEYQRFIGKSFFCFQTNSQSNDERSKFQRKIQTLWSAGTCFLHPPGGWEGHKRDYPLLEWGKVKHFDKRGKKCISGWEDVPCRRVVDIKFPFLFFPKNEFMFRSIKYFLYPGTSGHAPVPSAHTLLTWSRSSSNIVGKLNLSRSLHQSLSVQPPLAMFICF